MIGHQFIFIDDGRRLSLVCGHSHNDFLRCFPDLIKYYYSFFELLRVSHILSGLEEHRVPCCGGSRNEAVAVELPCVELWLFEELGKLSGVACDC